MTITNCKFRGPCITPFIRLLSAAAFALLFSAAAAATDVSPEVQRDLLTHRLIEAIKVEDHKSTLSLIGQLRSLKLPLVVDISFFEANALLSTGKLDQAEAALKQYIEAAGPKGANYKPAIALLSQLLATREEKIEAERRAAQAHAAMLAASVRIGKITRIESEWGYAVVALDAGAGTGSGAIYALPADGKRVDLKPGKLNGGELSVSVADIRALAPGVEVYRGPGR